MRNNLQITGFYFSFMIVSILLSSCFSEETKIRNRNKEIRKVVEAYDTVKSSVGIKYSYNFFRNSQNEEVRLFNEVISDYYENWDNRYLRDKIDSILKLDAAMHFPELMLHEMYYYYARIELKYLHPKTAYQLNLKSLDYVEKYPQLFSKEIARSKRVKVKITKSVSNSPEYTYNKLKTIYQNDFLMKSKKFDGLYNLAISASQTKRYSESNSYLQIFFKEFPNPQNHVVYAEALSLKAWNYAMLHQYDSLKLTDGKALKLYQDKEFDKVKYYNFLCHTVVTNYHILDEKQILDRINNLLSFYEKSCKKSYSLTLILEAESRLYEYLKDIEKEKASLMKELDFIELCRELDDYGLEQKKRIYLRLFKIANQQNDSETMKNCYNKLNELDSMEMNYKNEFIMFSHYLSQRDRQLSQQNFEKYKEDIQDENKIYRLYTLSIGLFLVLAIFLVILYRKNLKNKKSINEKNKEIKTQNKTVKVQNRNLKNVIRSLDESNKNLNNFAQVAAHDIKSPIATIQNGINYLQDYYRENIREEDLFYFENLKTKTEDLVEMIDELLNHNLEEEH